MDVFRPSIRIPALIVLLLLPLALLTGCDEAHEHEEDQFLYVANQNSASVTVFNMTQEKVETTVDLTALGFSATSKPHHVSVEPDGSAWYVSLIGDNKVVKFSRGNTVLGQVTTEVPGMMALDPDGTLLAVGRSMSAVNPPASVAFINRKTMTLEGEQQVIFQRPHALGFAPGWVFTASLSENRLAAIPADGSAARFSTTGGSPTSSLAHMGVSPDGKTVVVTGDPGGKLYFLRPESDGTFTFLAEKQAGQKPWHPHYTPDGRQVVVPLKGENAVLVLDAQTHAEIGRVTGAGLSEPHGTAFSHDGKTIYISNNNTQGTYQTQAPGVGTLVVIDAQTRKIRKVFEVGANPAGLGHAAHGSGAGSEGHQH